MGTDSGGNAGDVIILESMAYAARLFTDLHDSIQAYAQTLGILDPVAADHLLRVALAGVSAATDELSQWLLDDSAQS
ncbi:MULTISPECIES: hypothetical protein [Micrococcaceae]|uniref:hypothetical protein n=1 Tax=Micrococcaceae TaxID=1268 RepID=UPI0008DE95FD|nr:MULTISPECIES: hypothetical protein [Micrococcaceae]OIH81746.1 hypothetical protein BLJ79_21905 [Arthrobacter sp. UCD-GKA]PCC36962.1 hypothetical protein CIK74_03180 [Glutamicibacter sp. BW77]